MSTYLHLQLKTVEKQFSKYQLVALDELSAFKMFFSSGELFSSKKFIKKNKRVPPYRDIKQEFIELFCGYDLADTDYSFLLKEDYIDNSFEDWVKYTSLETVLKKITYIIWTDNVSNNYFEERVKDNKLFLLLERMERLLQLHHYAVAQAV